MDGLDPAGTIVPQFLHRLNPAGLTYKNFDGLLANLSSKVTC